MNIGILVKNLYCAFAYMSCRSKGERKYKLKMAELGLKRDELRRLGLDYQRRMKLKEVSLLSQRNWKIF